MRLKDKKKGIRLIEQIVGEHSCYMGPPTFEYKIGKYTVDRDGNIKGEDIDQLIQKLADGGIDAEGIPNMVYTVCSPTGCRNLLNMIHSKQYLLERAFGKRLLYVPDDGSDPVGIKTDGVTATITGFPDTEMFRTLAQAMINTAESSKWISPDETIEENEKYYMRAWLVRIGLGGEQHKELRKTILDSLKGNTAFRTKEAADKWKEQWL